jgi:excisionase family DNA binding protein
VSSLGDQRLLTIKQTAEQLACSEANVYALISAGQLPFVRIGRRKGLRIDTRDLEDFIESRKVQYEQARPTQPRPRLKHIKL